MLDRLQHVAMRTADGLMAIIPQPVPSRAALEQCKVISHRGEHDNHSLIENTLPAFEKARANGVWGIECDIRWTKDLVPVVSHDACGRRLFNRELVLAEASFEEVRREIPQIPSLAELFAQFAGNTHLMLEIKDEHYPQPQQQKNILREMLQDYKPGEDYHFLALDPELFSRVDFVAREFCYPVSELNSVKLSRAALAGGYGGLTGHFLLLGKKTQGRHEAGGQKIGTGFVSSRNCLFRELNRGIEWVFSNDAVKIQKILDDHLR